MNTESTTPLFSIITVARNASQTIGRTLESVDCQTCTDYEHLIVDGASTDGTQSIVEAGQNPRRSIISEPDRGLYDAMNKGMSLTSGKYLLFLNAGDKLHDADTLAAVAQAIENNDFPGIVYGQTLIVDNDGNRIGERHLKAPDTLSLKSFGRGMVVCHQAFYVLRKIAGGYDPHYRFSADYDWCVRALQHSQHNVGLTDRYLVDYLNEGLTTQNHRKSLWERFRIMKRYYGLWHTVALHARLLFKKPK